MVRRPETIRGIADLADRARAAQAATAETQRLANEYADITATTVVEMLRTMSYGAVAAELGVSRTRIQQLEKRGRWTHGGGDRP